MRRMSLVRQWGEIRYPRLSRLLQKTGRFLIKVLLIGLYHLPPSGPEPKLISLTQEVWSKRLGRPVPEDEALEIIRSFRNLLDVLKEVKGVVQH